MIAGTFVTFFEKADSHVEVEQNSLSIILRNRVKGKK